MENKYIGLSAINNLQTLQDKLRSIKHIALDMDGTIYKDNTLFPFTIPFLNSIKQMDIHFSFLTNNSTRSVSDYQKHLSDMGIKASRDEIITSAQAAIDYLKTKFPQYKKLFILGTQSMIEEFEAENFISAKDDYTDKPDAVIVSFDKTLVYERLCRAAFWISQGLPYIATHPDKVCPTNLPTVLIDCGSICACLESATNRKPDIIIGKPDPRMLSGIFEKYNLSPYQTAVAGDRIYTDVRTAYNAGAVSVLVLTGETTIKDVENSDLKPDIIVDNLEILGKMIEEARNL